MVATRRRFEPNLQRVRILVNGAAKRAYVCTRCLKGGKVQKAPRPGASPALVAGLVIAHPRYGFAYSECSAASIRTPTTRSTESRRPA